MPDSPVLPPLIVVDAANVVGSVPNGWWRDRRGAAERLRDRLAGLSAVGMPPGAPDWARVPPLEVVLVVEGAARDVESSATVRTERAPGVGDDAIVDIIRNEQARRRCLVVTSDRGLRSRVEELGAEVCGASVLTRAADPGPNS